MCLKNSGTFDSFCFSQVFAKETGAISGLTGDRCSSTSECEEPRICVSVLPDVDFRCTPVDGKQDCSDSGDSDCQAGELCLIVQDSGENNCYSKGFADEVGAGDPGNEPPEGDPPDDDPSTGDPPCTCVAVHLLKHLSRDELVFKRDILANVLCDQNDSCATPGHMVTYQGKGMMMKTYCEIAGCIGKVMHVNSPRYRRGITVPSRSDGMAFTAFSARYATRAEEGMLSVAIRVGF